MSYDIELKDGMGDLFLLPYFIEEGGTYPVGGTNRTELNITFNYGKLYREFFHEEGLCWIAGKQASETNLAMAKAVRSLGVERFEGKHYTLNIFLFPDKSPLTDEQKDFLEKYKTELSQSIDDLQPEILQKAIELKIVKNSGGYWKATPGNAGYAMNILLQWGLRFPCGTWSVDN